VDTRVLAIVPKRLGVMDEDNAVTAKCAVVPGRGLVEACVEERADGIDGGLRSLPGHDVWNNQVAVLAKESMPRWRKNRHTALSSCSHCCEKNTHLRGGACSRVCQGWHTRDRREN
jgi:hypothetical protein